VGVEGGRWIRSLPARLAFLFETDIDDNLEIRDCNGQVLTRHAVSGREAVVPVTASSQGCHVAWLVKAGRQIPLPDVQADGCGLRLEHDAEKNNFQLTVALPEGSRYSGEGLSVVMVNANRIVQTFTIQPKAAEPAVLSFAAPRVANGLGEIAVFHALTPLATRLYAMPSLARATAEISTDSVQQARAPATLTVALRDGAGNPVGGHFSVKVAPQRFSSESPVVKTSSIFSPQTFREAELLVRHSVYPWAEMLAQGALATAYNTMITYQGRAFFSATGKPVPDSTQLFFYLQKNLLGYECITDGNGNFELAFLFDFYGDDELFYMAERKGTEMKGVQVEWITPPVPLAVQLTATSTQQPDDYGSFQRRKRVIDQAYEFYQHKITLEPAQDANADFEDEIQGADVQVNVQDYIAFPTVIELMREVIPSLQHRKLGGKSAIRVLLSEPPRHVQGNPLLLIDGVMTKNIDHFLALKPSEISAVKIIKDVRKLNHLGALGKNGVVMVNTKRSNPATWITDNTAIAVQGLQRPLALHRSHRVGNRIPDFRSMILWQPNVLVDDSGKTDVLFYHSDDIGLMDVEIEGITSAGEPFTATCRYRVVRREN